MGQSRRAWCHYRIGPVAVLHAHRWLSSASIQTTETSHLHCLHIQTQKICACCYVFMNYSDPDIFDIKSLSPRQTGQHSPSMKEGLMQDTGGHDTWWHTTFPSWIRQTGGDELRFGEVIMLFDPDGFISCHRNDTLSGWSLALFTHSWQN